MKTIVGDNNAKKTKETKTQRIVNLDPTYKTPTNVSQYAVGGADIKDLENAKHWASEAEKSAKDAASSASKSETFMNITIEAAKSVESNTSDSFEYLEEIRQISTKIDGQEANIDEAEKQVILHTQAAERAAEQADASATQARDSEANSAASASSANNSAVSAKESEQASKASEISAADSATKAGEKLAQTEAVYDKTIDDVSKAVQSYLKDKGGFDPNAGLPEPDSWVDIFGVRKKLSCMWTAERAGTVPGSSAIPFNEGDILIYNAELNRYGRFSGQLVDAGGGGGSTEFSNDIRLINGKRLLGTDSKNSPVELIKLATDEIVEAGDKTKKIHLLSKDRQSAFVCVANAKSKAGSGFDNYQIYHEGNKPTPAAIGAYTKEEADAKFVDASGDSMTGDLTTTAKVIVKGNEVYHPLNKPTTGDIGAVSVAGNQDITGAKKFTKNILIENNAPALTLIESDSANTVHIKADNKKVSIGTSSATPLVVDTAADNVVITNPRSKLAQGTTDNSLTRKDYVDEEVGRKFNKAGGNISGNVSIDGKLTVDGTGSVFKDINTTGQIKENNVRVYSPNNKPNAVDVGALPNSGGTIGGSLNVIGNLSEKGQRVYSPNNKPTAIDVGALPLTGGAVTGTISSNQISSQFKGIRTDFDCNARPSHNEMDWSYTGTLNYALTPNLFPAEHNGNGILSFNTHQGDYWHQLGFSSNGKLYHRHNENTNWGAIYTESNKPTAADVGAIGIDNVYDKTQADARFWQKTETVNRAFESDKVRSLFGGSSIFKSDDAFRAYTNGENNVGYPTTYGSGIFKGRTSGDKSQGWSIWNSFNEKIPYFGKQLEDGSGFEWFKIYTESNKPTAADVGALSVNGGDVNGFASFNAHDWGMRTRVYNHFDNGTDWDFNYAGFLRTNGKNDGIGNTLPPLMIWCPHSASNGSGNYGFGIGSEYSGAGLYYYARNNEGTASYKAKIYHAGDKPTPSEIGALPIAGGTLLGNLHTANGIYPRGNGDSEIGNNIWRFHSGHINHLHSMESLVEGQIKFGTGVGSGSFGKLKHQAGAGGESWLTAIDDANAEHKAIGVSQEDGAKFWDGTNGMKRIYHEGFKPNATDVGALPTSGGRLTGAIENDGVFRTVLMPKDASCRFDGEVTGSIKVTLPHLKTSVMIKVHLNVYNYRDDTSFDAVLSGYPYEATGVWHNCSATITGASSTPNHPVYFGNDGSKACIWVGSVGQSWSYLHATVSKIEVGFSGSENHDWKSGWSISLVDSLGTLDRTISDSLIKPGAASLNADEQPTANTLIKRNASGEAAVKGRLLIASSNDSDVSAGTSYIDFVSAAGNSFGKIGDASPSSNNLSIRSESPVVFTNLQGNLAQKIHTGGLLASGDYNDAGKVPNNGAYIKGDINADGILNLNVPHWTTTSVTGLTGAPIKYSHDNVGDTATFIPMLHKIARHTQGYTTHLNVGLYKSPTQWGEGSTGMYVALGGNDNHPTEHFTMCFGGKIKHSKGHEFYSTAFKPTPTDLGLSDVKLNWDWGTSTPSHIWGSQGDAKNSYVYNGNQLKDFVGLSSLSMADYNTLNIQTHHGVLKLGPVNEGHCHYITDRTNHWFNTDLNVSGEIYAGAGYNQRVYHQGFKPTAADVNAKTNEAKSFYLKGDSSTYILVKFPVEDFRRERIRIWRNFQDDIGGSDPNWNGGSGTHFGSCSINMEANGNAWGGATPSLDIGWSYNYTRLLGNAWVGSAENYCVFVALRPSSSGNGALYYFDYPDRSVVPDISFGSTSGEHAVYAKNVGKHLGYGDMYVRGTELAKRWGQSNWTTEDNAIHEVSGLLAWKNYGNNHVIFDASAGTTPSGTACDKNNSSVPWQSTHPTLMGWNGAGTFGVRVDTARYSDSSHHAVLATQLNGTVSTNGQDLVIHGKRAIVGVGDQNNLIINYDNDFGNGTTIIGNLGISGTLTGNAIRGTAISGETLGVTGTSGDGKGLSLYGGASAGLPEYGISFATTANYGTHGETTGDWATYFTMTGGQNRGWIFRHLNGGNVASINAYGSISCRGVNVDGVISANNVTLGGVPVSTRWKKGYDNVSGSGGHVHVSFPDEAIAWLNSGHDVELRIQHRNGGNFGCHDVMITYAMWTLSDGNWFSQHTPDVGYNWIFFGGQYKGQTKAEYMGITQIYYRLAT